MKGRLVYSTDPSFVPPCEGCGEPPSDCRCRPRGAPPPSEQKVRVRIERKGRGGKIVTVIDGLQGPQEWLKDLAAALKGACGTGGTSKDGAIELQGDHRDRAVAALAKRGFDAKRAGG